MKFLLLIPLFYVTLVLIVFASAYVSEWRTVRRMRRDPDYHPWASQAH